MEGLLQEPVSAFSTHLGACGISRDESLAEAADLVAALVGSDGRFSDAELEAWVEAFGSAFDDRLPRPGSGSGSWLDRPSPLFARLAASDSEQAWGYYKTAIDLAYAVAALDEHPAMSELRAIDAWTTSLRGAIGAPHAVATGATERDEPLPTLEELLAELDALVGLHAVKEEVRLVTALLRVAKLREAKGLPVADASHHLVFTGNPGTGKTTVARLLGGIYRALGVVAKGHLVETDRSQLVAGFVGQTAIKVREVVTSALGGLLLIDEAYALVEGGESDFGREAVSTLVKLMEDHRHDLVVIVAGYPEEMKRLVQSNPGLSSRFPKTIAFPDYTTDELVAIFRSLGDRDRYIPEEAAIAKLRALIDSHPRDRGFGNARLVRNLFEAAMHRQARRLQEADDPSEEDLCTLLAADIPDTA